MAYMHQAPKTIRFGKTLMDLRQPRVMGILNITSDSFYAPSRVPSPELALNRAAQMLQEGADILDIGAQSTRPGAVLKGAQAEIDALLPVVEVLRKAFPAAILSIDTFHAEVAEAAVLAGAHMINDVSGGQLSPQMFETVARLRVPYVCMHMRGTPETMGQLTHYENLLLEVYDYFLKRLAELQKEGVNDIILDFGFGFAKTLEQNIELMNNLHIFVPLNQLLLVGLSRKSMIYKTLNATPEDTLPALSALHMVALQKGANILRVHDVRPAKQCIAMWDMLNRGASSTEK